jgi:ferritin-like metal-binding protein YciE
MTANEQNELYVAWLKDAYAMEEALIPNLENHAKDASDFPQIQTRIQQHLEETRRHAELVRGCLERMGEKPSATKVTLGKIMGTVGGMGTGAAKDELVKNFLADYAAEHQEIASYMALIVAAQDLGDQQTAQVCQQILQDEQSMARDIEANLPMVVQETLHLQQAGR